MVVLDVVKAGQSSAPNLFMDLSMCKGGDVMLKRVFPEMLPQSSTPKTGGQDKVPTYFSP